MQVADILRHKGSAVATIAPNMPVAQAVEALREHAIGALVVSVNGERIDGIVSERDIVRALHGPEAPVLERLVADVMTTPVRTCSPADRIEGLMVLMTEHRIRHLPVEVDGRLAGIISIGDVVKARVAELEGEARALEDYIHHGR